MNGRTRRHVDDLRGATRLAVEATKGVTELVQDMHRTIGSGPSALGRPLAGPVRLMTGLVYGSIKGVTGLVGTGLDLALEQLAPLLGESDPGPEREAIHAALNGVLGDHLAATSNPLAIEMRLRRDGQPLDVHDPETLERALSHPSRHLVLMVHGSCMNDRQWSRRGHDHGAALERDLDCAAVYVHYNSGRHISDNGDELATLLEALTDGWPGGIERISIVAHSMGGLVTRSACHAAEKRGHAWRDKLHTMVFLGTPHHGAPLERGGNWVDLLLDTNAYSAPFARLTQIRSAGVTDLRFGNVLEEHWQGRDRFALGGDPRRPLSLPKGVACFAVAGQATGGAVGELTGDGLVPVDSALGVHSEPALNLGIPETRRRLIHGVAHLDLLDHADVYQTLRDAISSPSSGAQRGNNH